MKIYNEGGEQQKFMELLKSRRLSGGTMDPLVQTLVSVTTSSLGAVKNPTAGGHASVSAAEHRGPRRNRKTRRRNLPHQDHLQIFSYYVTQVSF